MLLTAPAGPGWSGFLGVLSSSCICDVATDGPAFHVAMWSECVSFDEGRPFAGLQGTRPGAGLRCSVGRTAERARASVGFGAVQALAQGTPHQDGTGGRAPWLLGARLSVARVDTVPHRHPQGPLLCFHNNEGFFLTHLQKMPHLKINVISDRQTGCAQPAFLAGEL